MERRRFVVTGCSGVVAALDGSGDSLESGATWHEKQVRFGTDAAQEKFEGLYALELDEQPHEVQDRGLHAVERFVQPERWLESLELGPEVLVELRILRRTPLVYYFSD